jgi:hypothetical protein
LGELISLQTLRIIPTIDRFCRQFQSAPTTIVGIEQNIEVEEEQVLEPLKIVIFRVLQEGTVA